jgi:hypothetical protein
MKDALETKLKKQYEDEKAEQMRAAMNAAQAGLLKQREREYNRMKTAIKSFVEKRVKEAQIKTAQEAILLINQKR